MPKSKNRKNHKSKVANYKNRTTRKKKMLNDYFQNMLTKMTEQKVSENNGGNNEE
jgi:hypothetical protein